MTTITITAEMIGSLDPMITPIRFEGDDRPLVDRIEQLREMLSVLDGPLRRQATDLLQRLESDHEELFGSGG